MEGSAKRVFLKGAAKLCFSLICGKLLGKCHFQGFVFAASYRGNCNLGGFYLLQAFRKLSVHFQQALGNFAFAMCSDLQQAIGEVLFPGFRVCSKL